MITVTFFLWFDPAGKYNAKHVYTAGHVNAIKRNVHDNLSIQHRFVCVSDRTDGFDPDIDVVAIDQSLIRDGKRWPKLMIFRPDAASLIGERILMMDIDADVYRSINPLVDRSEEFVGWKNPNTAPRHTVMNSSIVLLTAGSRRKVWDTFDINEATAFAVSDRRGGSDQAHMSRVLGDNEAMWTERDGIHWAKQGVPDDARIVFHAGWNKPARFAA